MPCLRGLDAVRLFEGLADCGGHDGVLAIRDVGQSVAHPVDAAALPGRFEDANYGGPGAGVGITDDQPYPIEAATAQGPQEFRPESLGLEGSTPSPMISLRLLV